MTDFAGLNWIDFLIIGVISFSMIISLIRGFVREALSLAFWIIAFWVAITFAEHVSVYLSSYMSDAPLRMALSFFILFASVLILNVILNMIISRVVDKTGLSGTDRILGAIFGAARGVLLVAVLLLMANLTAIPSSAAWQHSKLVATFSPIETWLKQYVPENLMQKINAHTIKSTGQTKPATPAPKDKSNQPKSNQPNNQPESNTLSQTLLPNN